MLMLHGINHGVEPCTHAVGIGLGRVDGAQQPPRGVERIGVGWIYAVG
jgi:hypothetical protein